MNNFNKIVVQIFDTINPKPIKLLDSEIKFIRKGNLFLINKEEKTTKLRHIFLFNTCLLITKKKNNNYNLKTIVYLDKKFEIKYTDDNLIFQLIINNKKINFVAQSSIDKNNWLCDLSDILQEKKIKRLSLLKEPENWHIKQTWSYQHDDENWYGNRKTKSSDAFEK